MGVRPLAHTSASAASVEWRVRYGCLGQPCLRPVQLCVIALLSRLVRLLLRPCLGRAQPGGRRLRLVVCDGRPAAVAGASRRIRPHVLLQPGEHLRPRFCLTRLNVTGGRLRISWLDTVSSPEGMGREGRGGER